MALHPSANFVGKINAPSPQFPWGSARNVTTQNDGTGTPFLDLLINDQFGFFQTLLNEAGLTPSGTPDNVLNSQYLEALNKLFRNNSEILVPTFSALGTGTTVSGYVLKTSDIIALYNNGGLLKTVVNNNTSNAGGASYKILTTAEKDASEYAGTEGYSCIEINGSGYWACLVYNGINTPYSFGATANNVSIAIKEAIKFNRTADVPAGVFQTPTKVDFQPYPVTIQGKGNATNIHIPTSNPDSTAFRFAAVGGTNREMSKISGLNFTCDTNQTATAIDAQAVFPISLSDIRCYQLGADAIKYYQIYYGTARDMYLFGSGLNFENVNNYTFDGGDFHGNNPLTVFTVTDYTHLLDDCDRITFDGLTFEGYLNRVIRLVDCKDIHFRDTWFEANTPDHCIKAESCQDIHFTENYLEMFPSPTSSFILVDNSNVTGINRTLTTLINVTGGYVRLNTSTSSNFKFIDIVGAGKAKLIFKDLSLRSGSLLLHYDCTANVSNVTLATTTGASDEMKFLESLPNADITNGKNNWLLGSEMSDKSMSGGAIVTDTSASTAVITTDAFTHDNGISTKVAIPAAETNQITLQRLCSDLTTITTEGETYVFFVRCYCTHNIPIQFIVSGNILDYQVITPNTTKATQWIDYVIKTDHNQTWTLGNTGSQKLKIKLTNTTGQDVDFYIDRIDYKKVLGDHYLP